MSKVIRNRNNGEWTESKYWGQVRSALRNAFRYWKPAMQCKINARRKYKGKNKKQKWEYQCAKCKQWFKGKDVQIDHIVPVGSLKSEKDLVTFLKNLTPEDVNAFQVLCKKDHKEKTQRERKA